ncbi:MAG: L,D-transpeptidase [Leptolyngbya sp. IPPAS B-1204]|uniref:L,D-transpeptidase n=1 Tax=Leptolyngbya sp. NK1-12 TaxID=2547451 RepID=A0AA97AHK9_9CYAN|nr:L,D-transpeptidase [Leptolyngbya sp. NK1-12]MBF2051037.1 L,D-transpeptidase [Elainella sp. C42_A2020_010]RNJ66880.1 MAG: L,D-transpeptidase [Leptolyngbya sp. IPPAS B-1204]WNZ22831.1 L,D-transpeptidase [Leptolyngbya sp. NK1-12]
MAIRKQHDALSASFMVLSFATAALLIGMQITGERSRSVATNSSSRPATSSTVAQRTPPATQTSTAQKQSQSAAQPNSAQSGLDQILSASHPVALMRQSRLVVDLSERQVSLYQDGRLQVSYAIAVGREGWETPAGEFRVINMQENPAWQNPITGETFAEGIDNPLGSRWIGFWTDGTHQIGFHGTRQEEFIGQAVSHGCIRMREADIQSLYTQVAIGTPVIVQP